MSLPHITVATAKLASVKEIRERERVAIGNFFSTAAAVAKSVDTNKAEEILRRLKSNHE